MKIAHINFLREEKQILNIKKNLEKPENQQKIRLFKKLFEEELCNGLPSSFWKRKKHEASLLHAKTFHENQIPTKARSIQMNKELVTYCQTEI